MAAFARITEVIPRGEFGVAVIAGRYAAILLFKRELSHEERALRSLLYPRIPKPDLGSFGSPHPPGAKRLARYIPLILDEGAVSFLLSGYPFRTVPRKEGPPWTWPAPRRSRSSLSFSPSLSLAPFLSFSRSRSSSLVSAVSFWLSRASHRIQSRLARRKRDGAAGGAEGGDRGKAREKPGGKQEEEPEVWRGQGLLLLSSRTRSVPFHGAALSRALSLSLSSISALHNRINAFTYVRTYVRPYGIHVRGYVDTICVSRAMEEKRRDGGRERNSALYSTQRRANPMGP